MTLASYAKKQHVSSTLENALPVKRHSVEIAIERFSNHVDSAKGVFAKPVLSVS